MEGGAGGGRMNKTVVTIVMGSDSDLDIMKAAKEVLDEFDVGSEVIISSAHRTPDATAKLAKDAASRGIKVIIAGAGYAAHLAGVIAANTTLPVIGVPLDVSSLNGLDSLLSTVQMPAGIPVATMTIGKAGAKNAAIFALEILALSDDQIADELQKYRSEMVRKIEEKNKRI